MTAARLVLALAGVALLTVAGTKTLEEILDPALVDSFLEEVREAVDLCRYYAQQARTGLLPFNALFRLLR